MFIFMYTFSKVFFSKNILNSRTCFSKSRNPQFSIINCSTNLHAFVLGNILGDSYITRYGRLQVDHTGYEYTK